MKLNPKQLAASAALLGVLACAAALPASAAGPVTTPLALTLPKVSFPWDRVTAESIETGSYDAAPLAGTAQQLSPARPGSRYDLVGVAHYHRPPKAFGQHLGIHLGERPQPRQRRILFKNDLAVRCRKDLKGITLAYPLRPPDLFWNDDAAQFIDAAHNSGCFHKTSLRCGFVAICGSIC